MQHVLLDERENIYVIGFSETRPRNIVSDLARLEPIVTFEMVKIDDAVARRQMLEFEKGLISSETLDQIPPFTYTGSDPSVHLRAGLGLAKEVRGSAGLLCEAIMRLELSR